MNLDYNLVRVVDTLTNAINENYLSIEDPEKGYPYAAGYSRSAMKAAIDDLNRILEYLRTDDL